MTQVLAGPRRERWPGYMEDRARSRKLAYVIGDTLHTPEAHNVSLWSDFKRALFAGEKPLEVFTNSFTGAPWFEGAIGDPDVEVFIPSSVAVRNFSQISGLRVKGPRRRTAWIEHSRTWGAKLPNWGMITALQEFFDIVGVGERPTTGSLGQALMRRSWEAQGRRWVERPTNACRLDILRNGIGGRVDYLVSPLEQFEKVFEYDLTGAYASVCNRLPDGHQVTLLHEPGRECVTWQMDCKVTIPPESQEVFGIFGVKTATGNRFPCSPGEYSVWLWKEEAEMCRSVGWVVEPIRGWGWTKWNTGLGAWAEETYQLRTELAQYDDLFSGWMKLAVVAGLGRFGMPLWKWKIVPAKAEYMQPGDMALLHEEMETGLAIHREYEWGSNALSHWYYHIMMRCRLKLRERMEAERRKGNRVLASNYDAVFVAQKSVFTGESLDIAGLGGWKEKILTEVRFPYPRAVQHAGGAKLPGTPKEPK